eukprot:TRINITY_DN118_c0_g1_i1.p1 TRINITY_DN118_c0_g1~~TRINITY_DN118_c0_g1_i1.p1  ORF type:complete len:398 (+),score=69.86 TRINITY_DN118_c0_g1_i1:268-1461(+)
MEEWKNRYRNWKNNRVSNFVLKLGSSLLSSAKKHPGVAFSMSGILGTGLFMLYVEYKRIPNIIKSFEKGSSSLNYGRYIIERPDLLEELKGLMAPEEVLGYALICGEHGTGKTTLIKKSAHDVGKGVLYLTVSESGSIIPQIIEKANVDLTPYYWQVLRNRLFGSQYEDLTNDFVFSSLREASARYYNKHDKPCVLIIDDVNRLAKKDFETFEELIVTAKRGGDQGTLQVILVSSEGSVPASLRSISESSRMDDLIYIGDVNEKDTITYYENKIPGLSPDTYESFFDLTGGRLRLINQLTKLVSKGYTTNEVKDFMFAEIKDSCDAYSLKRKKRLPKDMIISLLEKKEIPSEEYDDIETVKELLASNIFSYHPTDLTLTFQSRAVEKYFEESYLHKQ